MVSIRALRPTGSDLHGDGGAAVVQLWEACGLTRPWNDPHADLIRAVTSASAEVLIAHTNSPDNDPEEDTGTLGTVRIVGTVMVGQDGHRGWVYYLAVHPDHRHAGVGRALMAAAESWLIDRDLPKIQFMVREGNESVLAFYAALGYVDQHTRVLGRFFDPAVEALRGS